MTRCGWELVGGKCLAHRRRLTVNCVVAFGYGGFEFFRHTQIVVDLLKKLETGHERAPALVQLSERTRGTCDGIEILEFVRVHGD